MSGPIEEGLAVQNEALYALLGIEPGAGEEDIQRAFRDLAQVTHPDHDASAGATSRMRDLIDAREELLEELAQKRPVDFEAFLARVVTPTVGRRDVAMGRAVADLVNRDLGSPIRVVNIPEAEPTGGSA